MSTENINALMEACRARNNLRKEVREAVDAEIDALLLEAKVHSGVNLALENTRLRAELERLKLEQLKAAPVSTREREALAELVKRAHCPDFSTAASTAGGAVLMFESAIKEAEKILAEPRLAESNWEIVAAHVGTEERATKALEKIAAALDAEAGKSSIWDLLNGIDDSLRELRSGITVHTGRLDR